MTAVLEPALVAPDDASALLPAIQIHTVADSTRAMEDLFSIDGVTYQIPKHVGANITLGYLRLARTKGDVAAIGWAAEKVLGDTAYTALMECDDLTPENLDAVLTVVHTKIMGAVEAGKGKGPKG